MLKKLSLLMSLLLAFSGLYAKDIVIYQTTDMHGHFFSRPDKQGNEFGGFARLSALLQATPQSYLLFDSGDFSSGAYEANQSQGAYSIDLMNKMGYTALTVGNHDSDFGDKGLSKMLNRFQGDVLAMNMSNIAGLAAGKQKAHAVYNVDGIRVGVIGVAMDGSGSERMKIVNAPSSKDFEKELQALQEQHVDVIVILAHDSMLAGEDVSKDKRTNILGPLEQTPSFYEIDLMLGGHAHTQRLVGKIANEKGQGPWLVEGGPYMGSVTKVVVHKDDQTGVISVDEPRFITLNGAEDEQIKKYLDSIRDHSLDERTYAVVPTLITKYPAPEKADRAPSVARLMADQMYKAIYKQEKIDLAAYSLNSTRSDYKPGRLSGRYFAEMAPYEEHAGSFDISGEHLLRAMTESIGFRDGKCFSVYGYSKNVHIEFTCNEGKDVVLDNVTINGKKVVPGNKYRMAMLTHLPRGFYEGKPFQILRDGAEDDGSVIKHYREVTSSAMLFNVIKQMKEDQGKEVPDFVAPSDVQIVQNDSGSTEEVAQSFEKAFKEKNKAKKRK